LLIAVNCSVFDEYEPEPNIYVVLSTETSFYWYGDEPWESVAKIGKTLTVGDTVPLDTFEWGFYTAWNGVTDADVRLKHNGQVYTLYEHNYKKGYYHLVHDFYFIPGTEWELEVVYPEGNEIYARTYVPGEFEILSPITDTFYDEDSLVWTESERAKGYGVWFRYWRSFLDDDGEIYHLRSGSFIGLFEAEEKKVGLSFLEADSIRFFISALDSNIYDYIYSGWNHVSNPEDYMHIEGAWGVFGAQTVVSRRYYLPLPDTTYPPAVDKE
jgi:hypothetical protein